MQLGLTPASHDPLGHANTLTGRGTKRTRGLRPDSEGKLSDKWVGRVAAAQCGSAIAPQPVPGWVIHWDASGWQTRPVLGPYACTPALCIR